MIGRFSANIADSMVKKQIIDADEFELYHYGLFVIISEIFSCAFCLITGVILRIAFPSVLFYFAFYFLHRFGGGFHAKTELGCQAATLSSVLMCMFAIKFVKFTNVKVLMLVFVPLCALVILLSPADTPQKALDRAEKVKFRKYTAVLAVAALIIEACICALGLSDEIKGAIFFAVLLQSVSLICGRLLNHKRLA